MNAPQKTETGPIPDWKPQAIKLSLELGPLVLFFLANARGAQILDTFPAAKSIFPEPIFLATGLFMVAMVISLILSRMIMKKIAIMPLVTGAVVLVFGGLTLWLQDDTFIKMKPTIVNVLFGAVLLGGMAFRLSLLKYVFGEVYRLKPEGWSKLTWRWGWFFLALAVLNEVIWRNFSTDFWVTFKVWGIMPLTIVFSMLQVPVLTRYALDGIEDPQTEEKKDPAPVQPE